MHAAERVAGGVEDAYAVFLVRRKDDEPVGGRRRAVKVLLNGEVAFSEMGDPHAAERVAGGVEDAHAARGFRRKDDEPVGGRGSAGKLAVVAPANLLYDPRFKGVLPEPKTELQLKSPGSCRPRPAPRTLSLSDGERDHASATRAWHGKMSVPTCTCHFTRVHGANRARGRAHVGGAEAASTQRAAANQIPSVSGMGTKERSPRGVLVEARVQVALARGAARSIVHVQRWSYWIMGPGEGSSTPSERA